MYFRMYVAANVCLRWSDQVMPVYEVCMSLGSESSNNRDLNGRASVRDPSSSEGDRDREFSLPKLHTETNEVKVCGSAQASRQILYCTYSWAVGSGSDVIGAVDRFSFFLFSFPFFLQYCTTYSSAPIPEAHESRKSTKPWTFRSRSILCVWRGTVNTVHTVKHEETGFHV